MNIDERTRDEQLNEQNESDDLGERDQITELDDDEFDDDDRGASQLFRVSVWLVSIVIVLVLIGIPVLGAIDTSRSEGDGRRDRESAMRAERAFVADQFVTAALAERAQRAASEWTRPSLHDDVDALVGFLNAREPGRLLNSEATLAPVACSTADPPGADCFQAWLRQPNGPEIVRIEFAVAIFNGEATVVTLRRIAAI